MSVCVSVPYRSPHRSSDWNETFTSCCKHSRGGFGNLKNLKIVLAGTPVLHFPYRGIHCSSDCDETYTSYWKHARGDFGNLKNLKIVLAGVFGVALQEHTPFIRL